MITDIGAVVDLPVEDRTVQGIVYEVREDEDATYIRYEIPGWGKTDADGNPLPNGRYITAEYYFPKTIDYSGIEKSTGMPSEYAGKTLEDFIWDLYPKGAAEQMGIVNQFIYNFDDYLRNGMGLFLSSKTKGSGKTMLASCIGNEIIRRRNLRVKFINVADYIQVCRTGDASEYRESTILILDDLGAQDEKHEWIVELVYGLINYRYSNRLPTIFTSNLPIDKCSKDDRILDRVYSTSMVIEMPEISIRRLLADRRKRDFVESLNKNKWGVRG